MDEDIINRFSHAIPAHSALYHCVDDNIFTKGKYAFKIYQIYLDRNGRNKPILNLERLKDKLFREIMWRYNERITKHQLLHPYFQKLTLDRKNDLKIEGFHIITGMSDAEDDSSGNHMIYPRTFVCKICGDMQMPSREDWQTFNPTKCCMLDCKGEYEQISLMMFCEDCGKIRPLQYSCGIHKKKSIRLLRGEKDSLRTWKVVCRICYEEKNPEKHRDPVDIFRLECNHKDENGNKVHEGEKKQKPLTIKEGGIYTPVVLTSVDIQETKSIDVLDLEYILIGLHLNLFKASDLFGEDSNGKVLLDDIVERYESFNQKRSKERFIEQCKQRGLTDSESLFEWKKKWGINIIENLINNLKKEYLNVDLETLNDYFSITSEFVKSDNVKYSNFIEQLPDLGSKEMRKKRYEKLRKDYGLNEITYIPQINLISSCIGLIHGINKFWEEAFVPHFNPIWHGKESEKKMISYTYPFETEGLLIELDRKKVVNWLINNKKIDVLPPLNSDDATKLLLKIERDTEAYVALKELIHTLSHVLINRSSIYTGLDGDSCSEMLFPNSASILIYTTSNINIGGFAYVFEHSLPEWFNDIDFDMKECTFDLTCIHEKGSCFSCLYLPEFVCSDFNTFLDRDAFIGYKRFKVSYW